MSEAAKENSYTHIKEEIEGVYRTVLIPLTVGEVIQHLHV